MSVVGVTGTSAGFDRLVNCLAEYARAHPAEQVWVQHGHGRLPPELSGASLVPRDALLSRMRCADVVVCHAGVGTLLDALSMGHVPVVIPRRQHLREIVNDHQLEITQALADVGRVVPVHDVSELDAAIELARHRRSTAVESTKPQLLAALAREARATAPKSRATLVWFALRMMTAWVPIRRSG